MTMTSVTSMCQLLCRMFLPLTMSDGVSSWLDSSHTLWVAHQDMWFDALLLGLSILVAFGPRGCPWAISMAPTFPYSVWNVIPLRLWALESNELGLSIYLKSGLQLWNRNDQPSSWLQTQAISALICTGKMGTPCPLLVLQHHSAWVTSWTSSHQQSQNYI